MNLTRNRLPKTPVHTLLEPLNCISICYDFDFNFEDRVGKLDFRVEISFEAWLSELENFILECVRKFHSGYLFIWRFDSGPIELGFWDYFLKKNKKK